MKASWPDAPIPNREANLIAVGIVLCALAFVVFVYVV